MQRLHLLALLWLRLLKEGVCFDGHDDLILAFRHSIAWRHHHRYWTHLHRTSPWTINPVLHTCHTTNNYIHYNNTFKHHTHHTLILYIIPTF
jgi:hypothetical protein